MKHDYKRLEIRGTLETILVATTMAVVATACGASDDDTNSSDTGGTATANGTGGGESAAGGTDTTNGSGGTMASGGSSMMASGGSGMMESGGSGMMASGGSGMMASGGSGMMASGGSGMMASGGSGMMEPGGSAGMMATGGDGGSAGQTTSTPLEVNGCAEGDYVDLTEATASRIIDWVMPTKACLKISAGQSVTWSGNFNAHPLEPWQGDTPNPVDDYTGATGDHIVVFDTIGTFGYRCSIHPSTMLGAIWVVP